MPFRLPALAAAALLAGPAAAGTITVTVTGASQPLGEVDCAIFDASGAFPLDPATALARLRLPATGGAVACIFEGLAPGRYAVAVSQDWNLNGTTDTNLFGIPLEPWGVSNGVRPSLRAPRFEEAAVTLAPGADLALTVEVAE